MDHPSPFTPGEARRRALMKAGRTREPSNPAQQLLAHFNQPVNESTLFFLSLQSVQLPLHRVSNGALETAIITKIRKCARYGQEARASDRSSRKSFRRHNITLIQEEGATPVRGDGAGGSYAFYHDQPLHGGCLDASRAGGRTCAGTALRKAGEEGPECSFPQTCAGYCGIMRDETGVKFP